MKDIAHDEAMAELYQEDPALAAQLLSDILVDGDQGELLLALRQLAISLGGIQTIAEKAKLNPTQLYRTLSADGNPTLSSLAAILKALGFQLNVRPAA